MKMTKQVLCNIIIIMNGFSMWLFVILGIILSFDCQNNHYVFLLTINGFIIIIII
jgi:hypothetical protein